MKKLFNTLIMDLLGPNLYDTFKIIGPDNDFDWGATGAHKGNLSTAQILSGLAPFLHAFTYHQYGGGGETDARAFAVYDR